MKPNGRRRWRKWLRNFRQKLNKEYGRAVVGSSKGAGYIRRHGPPPNPQPLPVHPWSARSLVGMSMGARKRKHAKAVEAVTALLDGRSVNPERLRMLRSLYRIGERLRPCPNCPDCDEFTYKVADDIWIGPRCGGIFDEPGIVPTSKRKGTVPREDES